VNKVICILIVLTLFLTAACAQASGTAIYRFTDAEAVGSMVSFGGKLIASDGLNSCVIIDTSAGAESIEIPLESLVPAEAGYWYINNSLVPADDGIYMIFYGIDTDSFDTGIVNMNVVLAKYSISDDGLVCEKATVLDWNPVIETLGDYALHETVYSPCITEGKLIGNVYSLDGAGYIITVDIADNSCSIVESDLTVMCPYKNGKVLVSACDHSAPDAPVIIMSYAPTTGESEELCRIESRNYYGYSYSAYDEARDMLYFVRSNILYSVTPTDANSLVAYREIKTGPGFISCAVTTEDGSYVCSSGSAIYKYDATLTGSGNKLTMITSNGSGYFEARDAADAAFEEAHPDVAISDIYIGNIGSENPEADIYILKVSTNDYAYVTENGMAAPLTESDLITGEVGVMYPFIREYAEQDGIVTALPVIFTATTDFCFYPYGFEAIGLSADDVPRTWMEFLKLMQDAPALLAENDEVTVFPTKYGYHEVREEVFRSMIDGYIMYLYATGQPISFDTPLLRGLIAEFEKIDFSALGMPENGEYKIYDVTEVLFSYRGDISPYRYSYKSGYMALPLAYAEDSPAYIPAELYVAMIDPDTGNMEYALEYLEYCAEFAPDVLRISLSPEYNEPVLSEMYKDDTEANFENDPFAWDATAESIAWYRSFENTIVITTSYGIDEANMDIIYSLGSKYLDGSISAEEYLTEADTTLALIVLEAK